MNIEKVLKHMFSYHWPSDEQLALFANERHGFGGDDASYGVIYPNDLDKYDREVTGEHIPDGKLEIYSMAFDIESLHINEELYLRELKFHLALSGKGSLIPNAKNV
jgi:hypothetical protein